MTKYQNINENIYNFELRIGEACSLELGDGSFYSIQLLSSQNLKLDIYRVFIWVGSSMPFKFVDDALTSKYRSQCHRYVYYQKDCIIQ